MYQTQEVSLNIPISFLSNGKEEPQRLVLLFHGYRQRAEWIFSELSPCMNEGDLVVAVNGPFPIPRKRGDRYELDYAWYFFDQINQSYPVSMEPALEAVEELVESNGWDELPKVVIGFSQGGYLTPFLSQRLQRVEKAIGIASRFRSEVLEAPFPCALYNIHGEEDKVVDFARSQKCFQELEAKGVAGRFITIPKLAHDIDENLRGELRKILESE